MTVMILRLGIAQRLVARLLEQTPHLGDYLFPARGNPNNFFSGWSKCKQALDQDSNLQAWTLHDLRRTFATKLAALGTPIHVTEKLLNHVSGTTGGIERQAVFVNRLGFPIQR